MKTRAKSLRQTICKKGIVNCKAVLDLSLSNAREGFPVYVYKCERCGLEEIGAKANSDKFRAKESAQVQKADNDTQTRMLNDKLQKMWLTTEGND
jgi:predicted nucleic acid-binding Zn ribbon protein